ncbi:MAG: TonB-dependent receptor plug domain-containing protein [Hellea sp.]
MRHYVISLTAILAVISPCGFAWGQDADVEASFDPAYFSQFQPNTASDMVSQIPGFIIQDDGSGERGLGQANLNILINGRRPSSKSSDAAVVLERIPATKVERIDILDGASLDIPGLSGQVANIVTSTGQLSGSWNYAARLEEGTEPQLSEGTLSIRGSNTSGSLEYSATIGHNIFTFSEQGKEQYFDGGGTLFEDRLEDINFEFTRPSADLSLSHTAANGNVANLNVSAGGRNQNLGATEDFLAITDAGQTGQSFFSSGEDEYSYEIGGDYSFSAGSGALKLIGLHRYENSDFNTSIDINALGSPALRRDFNTLDKEGEYIARAEYSWKSKQADDWQLSWEGAFNYLDSTTELGVNGAFLEPQEVRVEEQRTEANLTHSRKLSEKLNLQASLGAEYSEILVKSDAAPADGFFRPKGFLALSYDANERYTWRVKVERQVGQLNFTDFRDSRSLTDGNVNSGNVDIVPTQSWTSNIELERRDDKFLSGTLALFANYIEDPVDRILFPDGTEGPGNLDSAWLYGVKGNATWLLDRYGLKGMRLEASGSLQDSSIDDPITQVSRRLNNTTLWSYNINLRHDIPNTHWAWGANLSHNKTSPFLRLSESLQSNFDIPPAEYFITHKDLFGTRVRLKFENAPQWTLERERLVFAPDRNGQLIRREFAARKRGNRFSIEISDTF